LAGGRQGFRRNNRLRDAKKTVFGARLAQGSGLSFWAIGEVNEGEVHSGTLMAKTKVFRPAMRGATAFNAKTGR